MFAELSHPYPPGCLSDLRLDQYLADELLDGERARARDHLRTCRQCATRLEQMRGEHGSYHASAPAVALRAQLRRRGGARVRPGTAAAALALLSAAACLVWALLPASEQPLADETRLKGSEHIGFYVKHAGTVRRGADGERVRAGDFLRFTYVSARALQLGILSYDGAGHASVYVPFRRIAAGRNVALPLSVELDATLGRERVYGLFCAEPPPSDALLSELRQRSGELSAPPGCALDRLDIVKVAGD